MTIIYKQCLLERDSDKHEKMVSWIPAKGIRVGNYVELLGEDTGLWKVCKIYSTPLTEEQIKAKGDQARKGLPSVTGRKK
jgi:hypothetical protein